MGMAPLSTYKLHVKQQIAASKGQGVYQRQDEEDEKESTYCVSGQPHTVTSYNWDSAQLWTNFTQV
jgi:hypothetical protein